jgi:hypothetical protein
MYLFINISTTASKERLPMFYNVLCNSHERRTLSVGRLGILLLAFASTFILSFGSRLDRWPYFCSFQDMCFEMGPPLRRRVGEGGLVTAIDYWRLGVAALARETSFMRLLTFCISVTPDTELHNFFTKYCSFNHLFINGSTALFWTLSHFQFCNLIHSP